MKTKSERLPAREESRLIVKEPLTSLLPKRRGRQVAKVDDPPTVKAATLSDVLDSAWSTYLWWDQAGAALPIQVLGTRLILLRPPTPLERDVLLAACVDLAIGLRPYIPEMN